jgi:hypothetical protein
MRGGGHNLGWKPVSAMRTSSPFPSKRFKEIVSKIEILVYIVYIEVLDNIEILEILYPLYPLKKILPSGAKEK